MYSAKGSMGAPVPGGAKTSSRRFALKAATDAAHTRVEGIVQSAGMFDTLAGYKRFLAASWALRVQHEEQLDAAGAAKLWPLWPGRRIAHLIAQDMADLGVPQPPRPAPLHAAASEAELLGALYVLEGSSLGARLLVRSAASLGLSAEHGARHLHAQAGDINAWRSYVELMEASRVAPCHDTANAVFDRFAEAYAQAAV
jgi:heme oxygenase